MPYVDNYAHIFGAIGGFLASLVTLTKVDIGRKPPDEKPAQFDPTRVRSSMTGRLQRALYLSPAAKSLPLSKNKSASLDQPEEVLPFKSCSSGRGLAFRRHSTDEKSPIDSWSGEAITSEFFARIKSTATANAEQNENTPRSKLSQTDIEAAPYFDGGWILEMSVDESVDGPSREGDSGSRAVIQRRRSDDPTALITRQSSRVLESIKRSATFVTERRCDNLSKSLTRSRQPSWLSKAETRKASSSMDGVQSIEQTGSNEQVAVFLQHRSASAPALQRKSCSDEQAAPQPSRCRRFWTALVCRPRRKG